MIATASDLKRTNHHRGRAALKGRVSHAKTRALAPVAYSGITTVSFFGIPSYVARSIPRCAITNSAGVCASH